MSKLPKKPAGKESYHWHHIIPQSRGGSDEPDNLVLLTPMEHVQAHKDRYDKYGDYGDLQAANYLLAHIDNTTGMSYRGYKQSPKHIAQRVANTDQVAKGLAVSKSKMGHVVTEETKDKISASLIGMSRKGETEANRRRSEAMKLHRLQKWTIASYETTMIKGMM